MKVTYCDNCKRMVGISCACGMPLKDKIKTLNLDGAITASRTKKKYWDQGSLNECFGEDATEKSMDLTDGHGFNHPEPNLEGLFD